MLEDLYCVELEGVVDDGVEDENAPGLHIGDGLERLDGETSGHAADELVASDGPDGIAGSVGLLDGQRELEAPFEHHLENDIEFSAVRFNHIKHELPRLRTLDARVVESKNAETDVRKPLGFFVEHELAAGIGRLGFNFIAH